MKIKGVVLLLAMTPTAGFAQQSSAATSDQNGWWSQARPAPSVGTEADGVQAAEVVAEHDEQAIPAQGEEAALSSRVAAPAGTWRAQDFECVEVHRFETVTGFIENKRDARAATIPSEKLSAIQSLVAGYIPEKLDQLKSTTAENGAPSCPNPDRALVLDGRITDFKKGNQALRYFVGFGAGAQKFSVLTRVTRKSDGVLISEGEVTDYKVGGWIGGQADKGQDDFAEKVVDFLKKSLAGKH